MDIVLLTSIFSPFTSVRVCVCVSIFLEGSDLDLEGEGTRKAIYIYIYIFWGVMLFVDPGLGHVLLHLRHVLLDDDQTLVQHPSNRRHGGRL